MLPEERKKREKFVAVLMDRILKPFDKESMRMAMLKHEETFKEQVYELHRLYRIQKMLMTNMKSSGTNGCGTNRWNVENEICTSQVNSTCKGKQKPRKLDLERLAEGYIAEEGDGVLEIEDESDIELTLGPTSYRRRKKDETPLTSDSGPSFSSSSTDSSHMKRTGAYKRMDTREELTGHEWGLIQVPDMHPYFPSGTKNNFDVEEQVRQEKLNRPPWLVHIFSMNMT
ncbi:hypothetical protein NE237_016530 [Protea cynaroides]|uniref:Uncharacterized protein n=1 Tax=Protea cynaroides TaxID=273540 RepID=A0A9Q0K699_9MAGN|nr:hypothetical protein NE237_016530 [Protea cynaroides]